MRGLLTKVKSADENKFCHPNKAFFGQKHYLCNVFPKYRKPRWAEAGQAYIWNKAFLCALVLTCRNLAVHTQFVKNKAMQNASWGVLYTALIGTNRTVGCCQERFLYTYTGVGLSALLVSTNWAMPEPLHVERVTEQAPRLLFVCTATTIYQPSQQGSH